MRANGTVAVALFLVTTVRASFGDDPKAATPNVAAWIERLGSSDEAQAREAQKGLLGRLRLGEDVRRTDEQKADLLTFEDALAGTDGARQRRLIGVLAELVDSNAFDLTDSWWDRFEIDSVARSWAGHGSLVLDPLLAIVRHGGNDSRDPLGETVALALAAIGDPAVDPLLRIVATPPDPIPGPDATDRDELLATAIGRFGARSRAAYALARIPSARERAIGPMIAHLLERDPSDDLLPGMGESGSEENLEVAWPGVRHKAFAGAGEIAIPPLLAALAKERAPRSRVQILVALRTFEASAVSAVPAIASLVDDAKEDHRVREAAVATLRSIRTEAVAEPLVRTLASRADLLRGEASFALYEVGRPAVPALRRALASEDANLRREAAQVLGGYGVAAEEALPDLMKRWDDEGADRWGAVRYACAEIAGSSGVVPAELTRRCVAALESASSEVRSGALHALTRTAGGAGSASAAVTRLADADPDPAVRTNAVMALAAIDSSLVRPAHLPLLVAELGQQMAHRREGARRAISRLPTALSAAFVRLVVAAAPGWEDYTYFEAFETLADLGPAAKAAIPFLEGLASDEGAPPERRFSMSPMLAKGALWRIRPDGVERAAKEIETSIGGGKAIALDDRILEALEKTGPRAAKAVPVLLRVLVETHGWDAAGAAEALGGIGTSPGTVVPALVAALDSKEWPVRTGAATGLGGYAATARAAVSRLVEALGDPAPDVRSAAAQALGRIGADAVRVVPALTLALRDRTEDVRREAAYALGLFGAAAAGALPALEAARDDREVPVQRTVARSLRAIRAAAAGETPAPMEPEPTFPKVRTRR